MMLFTKNLKRIRVLSTEADLTRYLSVEVAPPVSGSTTTRDFIDSARKHFIDTLNKKPAKVTTKASSRKSKSSAAAPLSPSSSSATAAASPEPAVTLDQKYMKHTTTRKLIIDGVTEENWFIATRVAGANLGLAKAYAQIDLLNSSWLNIFFSLFFVKIGWCSWWRSATSIL